MGTSLDGKKVVAMLPARMGSSRYPGKPLVEILGIPMIEHVRRRVEKMSCFDEVWVATCDKEIASVVESHGGRVVMTADSHERATDRVEEAAHKVEADIYVMVQGDEPMVLEKPLQDLVQAFESGAGCTCIVYPITNMGDLDSLNVVKTVMSNTGRLMYFSRSPIPGRDRTQYKAFLKQSGLMAYTKETLHKFAKLPATPLEVQESVDLNRLLENDIIVQGVYSELETLGVDVPEQVATVEEAIMADPEQKRLFDAIV